MTGPTTVRELLDMAVEQLDALSRDQISASPPSARSIAEAWPGFAATARQLVKVSVAFHNPHDRVQRAAASAATGGPCGPSTGAGEPRLARAADLIGAAADLVEPQARMVAAADRRAACVDAARVYLLGAQIMVHATMHDLRLLDTAAAAAAAARDAGKVLSGAPEQTSDGRLAQIATSYRPQPVAGDLLGLFDLAVFDWRAAALQAVQRPDVSSEDLRGAALGAGRIVALAQVLHRAHWRDHLPEAEARHMDRQLTRAGQGLATVASAWTAFATGTRASRDLVQASSTLQQAISLLACDGPGWAPAEILARRTVPHVALTSAGLAIVDVRLVIESHAATTTALTTHGRLFRKSLRSSSPAAPVTNVLARARWAPASGFDTAKLPAAYRQAHRGVYDATGMTANDGRRPPLAPPVRRPRIAPAR